MANVIKTVLTYPLDGSTTDFNIPFEYLARKFVVVTLLGVDRRVLMVTTDYRFATRTVIATNKAWGPADGYTQIEIRRVTSATERLVDFTDGSILRAYDLNVAQLQTMHVAEEARNMTADTIGVNNDGHLDARGRRIVNVANAIDDRDVVPFGQLKVMNQSSWVARNETLQFRNAAEQFCNESKANRDATATIKSETAVLQGQAAQSVVAAEQHRASASNSATAAAQSAASASRSEGIVTPLVPVAEKAAADAAQASKDARQAVQDVKDLGAVPVGTIAMFGTANIPAGWLSLMEDDPTFNTAEYPELARLYPSGQLPSYKDRVPEGIGSGITLGQKRAGKVGQTSTLGLVVGSGGEHSHGATFSGNPLPEHTHPFLVDGANYRYVEDMGQGIVGGGYMASSTRSYRESAYSNKSAGTPTGSVAVAQSSAHTHTISGTVGSGKNLVDATGTIFAIKAAGKVSDEGLMEVAVIKQDVESLKTSKADKANPAFTGDMTLNGSLRAGGSLVAGQGSNSTVSTTSFGESSAGNWVSRTLHQWYDGGVEVGAVRGASTDCQGLYRTRLVGKYIDYVQDPASGRHLFKNTIGQEALIVHPNGDLQMQWGGLLSAQILARSPKRWWWIQLGTMPVWDNAQMDMPIDVRGLRGFFGFVGQVGETVYKPFTFPPLDCRFQINRKGDWQVFELTNGGTSLIRRYGWNEGGDAYVFFAENPDA